MKAQVNPKSTSNQSSKPCTVLQYPSKKECFSSNAATRHSKCRFPFGGDTFQHQFLSKKIPIQTYWKKERKKERKKESRNQLLNRQSRVCIQMYTYRCICMYVHILRYIHIYRTGEIVVWCRVATLLFPRNDVRLYKYMYTNKHICMCANALY